MPLEIRELVIKATVSTGEGDKGSAPSAAKNNGVAPHEEKIQESLERMLEILKNKNER
jgi:hypothetical protein